jgi:hypothetical protein
LAAPWSFSRRDDVEGHIDEEGNEEAEEETLVADEDLKAELERLKAENERLKSRGRATGLKVSEKGGLSVYGLGRFPVTLYKEQWTKLLGMADEIRDFMTEHDAELKAKDDTKS